MFSRREQAPIAPSNPELSLSKMTLYSPSLYAHDLRLAESETGERSNALSPDARKQKSNETERRREQLKMLSTTLPMTTTTTPDALDLAIAFLKKRDGIDKVLKIARYAAKFLLAANQSQISKQITVAASSSYPSPAFASSTAGFSSPTPPLPPPAPAATLALLRLDQEPLRKLRAFESAVGDARKAYRMGKFLQGLDAARKAAPAALRLRPAALLAFLAAAGDGCYYFLDQFTFFLRAGVIHKSHARRLARAAAICELVGYFGSASLHAAAIAACAQREAELAGMLRGARKLDLLTDCRGEEDEDYGEDASGNDEEEEEEEGGPGQRRRRRGRSETPAVAAVERELSALSALRRSRERGLAQDACDALLALSDLNERVAANPTVLALAGLTSALLGAKKVWG